MDGKGYYSKDHQNLSWCEQRPPEISREKDKNRLWIHNQPECCLVAQPWQYAICCEMIWQYSMQQPNEPRFYIHSYLSSFSGKAGQIKPVKRQTWSQCTTNNTLRATIKILTQKGANWKNKKAWEKRKCLVDCNQWRSEFFDVNKGWSPYRADETIYKMNPGILFVNV